MEEIDKNKTPPVPPGRQIVDETQDSAISNPLGSDFSTDIGGATAAPFVPGLYDDGVESSWRDKVRDFFSDRRKLLIAGVVFILLLGGLVAFLLFKRGGPAVSETPADNNGRLPLAGQTAPDLNPVVYRPGDGTVVVFWITDRPTDGRVHYGLSQNYTYFADDQETLHPSRYATRHNVILRGLDSTQTYHLMASSLDRDGNLLFSNNITVRPIKDTVPPQVTIKTPDEGSKISGRARVCPQASDDQGIYSITFLIDDRPKVVRRENFNDCFEFDTSQFESGSHTLQFIVSDGVNTSSADVNVNIDNPSLANQSDTITVTITTPQNNQTVSGSQTASAQAFDSSGLTITNLEFYLDGVLLGQTPNSSGSFTFDTTQYSEGVHSIIVKAVNSAGQSWHSEVNIVFDNDGNEDSDGDGIPDSEDTNTGNNNSDESGSNAGSGGSGSSDGSGSSGSNDNGEEGGTGSGGNGNGNDVYGCSDLDGSLAVSLVQPQNGATLSGIANLQAQVTATGGKQIARVVFAVDLDPVRTVTTAPYNSTFNTAFYPDGQHVIRAVAVFTDGTCNDYLSNSGSHAATVTFDNFGPGSGGIFITNIQVVPTTNTLTISWVTNQATNSVVDYGTDQSYGQQVTDNQFVSSHNLTITGLQPNTIYYLRLGGSDQNGTNITPYQTFAQTLSSAIGSSVENCSNGLDDDSDGLSDNADPDCSGPGVNGPGDGGNPPASCTGFNPSITATITSPIDDTVAVGNLNVAADIQSNTSINRVIFMIDNQEFAEDTSAPYEATLSTVNLANGYYIIRAIAEGPNGQCSNSSNNGSHVVSVRVANPSFSINNIFATPYDIYANIDFKTAEPVTAEIVYSENRNQLNDPQLSKKLTAQLQPVPRTSPGNVVISSNDPVVVAVSSTSITAGETIAIRWRANIATNGCTASWRSGSGGIAGYQELNPTVTTTYTYSCQEFETNEIYTTNVVVEVIQPYRALMTDLTPRTTYYYKVIATSILDSSRTFESQVNSFTTLYPPSRNDMTASVSWAPACAGTNGIVKYSRLPLSHPSANPTTVTATLSGGRYTAILTGLQSSSIYYYEGVTQGGNCSAGGSIDSTGTFETPGG